MANFLENIQVFYIQESWKHVMNSLQIQEAVAGRDLPLKCLLCGSKIIRVKNNSKSGQGIDHPVHMGFGISRSKRMPKSVSGYSLCATSDNDLEPKSKHPSIAQSQSSYSMSSGMLLFSIILIQTDAQIRVWIFAKCYIGQWFGTQTQISKHSSITII